MSPATPFTTTPEICEHDRLEIKTKVESVTLTGTPTGLTSQVFSSDGWPASPSGNMNNLEITLDSEVTPEVNEVYFKVTGASGTTITVSVLTPNGTKVVEDVSTRQYIPTG